MSERPIEPKEPITDSPWFWIYLFATAALILLVVFRPKLDIRQADIERQHQARELSWQTDADAVEGEVVVSTPGNTLIGLNYLVAVLGILVAVGWARLWYVRFRTPSLPPNEPSTPR